MWRGPFKAQVYNLEQIAIRQSPTIDLSINERRALPEPATNQLLTRLGRTRCEGEFHVKKLLVVAAILALFASIGVAQEKTYEVPGVFSFNYSDGWNKGQRKGADGKELDWLVSNSDPNASFNAIMARAEYGYDDWIQRTVKTAGPDRVLASRGEFKTAGGEKGYKLVWKVKAASGEDIVRQQYLFRGKGDTQIVLSGAVDATNAEKFAPEFDAFAKSFTLIKSK